MKREKKKKKDDLKSLKEIFVYFKPLKKYFIISSIAILLSTIVTLPIPYLNMMLVDNVILQNQYSIFKRIMFVWFIILIIGPFLDSIKSYFLSIFDLKFDLSVKKDLFNKVLHLPMDFFNKNQLGYIQGRIEGDIQVLHNVSAAKILDVLNKIVMIIFGLIMTISINWKLCLIVLITIPLTVANSYYFAEKVKKMNQDVSEAWALQGGFLFESLMGIEVIKLFQFETKSLIQYVHKYNRCIDKASKKIKLDLIANFIRAVLTGLESFLIWGYGGYLIINKQLTIGEITAFVGYSAFVYSPLLQLANIKLNLQTVMVAWERIQEILHLRDENIISEGKSVLDIEKGEIICKNVSFKYEDSNEVVLKNINFHINPGELVAFIGGNGSGKSTFIRILLGLYYDFKGEVLIDGKSIAEYNIGSLRNQVGVVSQNIYLFNSTIYNNITMWDDKISEEEVRKVSKLIHLDEFISSLPDGYDTVLKEGGASISGGQRQLISIARALLKRNLKILIFDEGTSALDVNNEKYIYENIKEICKGKTFINIVHRESFIKYSEKVIEFNQGEIKSVTGKEHTSTLASI